MKRSLLHIAIALIAALVSCDDEMAPEAEFLTVHVDEIYTSADDLWMFASNEKGDVIDVVQFRRGQAVTLKTSQKYERIDLTILHVFAFSEPKTFELETYKNIPVGETWVLRTAPPRQFDFKGKAKITVNNYNEPALPPGPVLRATQATPAPTPNVSFANGSFDLDFLLVQSPTSVVLSTLKDKLPHYKIVSNFSVNDNVTVDFQTFQKFENIVEIKGINGLTYVEGINDPLAVTGQQLLSLESYMSPEALYVGSVPGFSRFYTRILSFQPYGEYRKVGTPVASYTFPSYTTTHTDKSFETFKMEIDDTYDYKEVFWGASTNLIAWQVFAEKDNSLGLQIKLPGQIANLYPTLKIKDISNWAVKFYRSNGTFTYSDFLARKFKQQEKLEYEQYVLFAR